MNSGTWINGKAFTTHGSVWEVINPCNSEVVARFPLADAADVDVAVRAATDAFSEWSRTTPAERSRLLLALARRIEERFDEYVRVETAQTGKPYRLCREFDVPGTIDNIYFFSGMARNLEGKASAEWVTHLNSSIRREAVGVVGSIAPWNYPLQMAAWKILPAITAGNTIVLKPAELTPLTSVMLAQDCTEVGFPPGVVNVVTGAGVIAGEALVSHPSVAMVSFTGSTRVGQRVMELATKGIKRIHLELGGKAPFIVFQDADLEAAIQGAVAASLINSGQDCTAATRAYVHQSLFDSFISGVRDLFEHITVGDPTDPTTDIGPLVSKAQQERVHGFVTRAVDHGARVEIGGIKLGNPSGSFYSPTLITGAAQDSEVVQEEIFGPVLVVLPFETADQGLALANDTPYGLAASAWTRSVVLSERAQREINAGTVWINDHIPIMSEMPHGGFGGSGFGKDMSTYSLEEYTRVKHVAVDISGDVKKEWHRTIFNETNL
jgi:betaine-aldehyde dehydrogenase